MQRKNLLVTFRYKRGSTRIDWLAVKAYQTFDTYIVSKMIGSSSLTGTRFNVDPVSVMPYEQEL